MEYVTVNTLYRSSVVITGSLTRLYNNFKYAMKFNEYHFWSLIHFSNTIA